MQINRVKRNGIQTRLLSLLVRMFLFFFAILIVMLMMTWYTNKRYQELVNNISICSRFNMEFKENVDLQMYYFAIKSDLQGKLPTEDVDKAMEIVNLLEETTVDGDSKESLQRLKNYCDSLYMAMEQMAETKEYEERMVQLNNNVNVLTGLIEEEMQTYIFYETINVAELSETLSVESNVRNIVTVITMVLCLAVMLTSGYRLTAKISKPIRALSENVRAVGKGNFKIKSVNTDYEELETLNEGILRMSKRIERLLANVKEENKKQREIELQLIQAQISPHFLYNTLDAIIWLIESDQHDEAVEMVQDLSVFFKTALSKGKDVITLREEIMHTESYLKVQKARYKDILSYEINFPEKLGDIMIHKLTIQPLVENALYHGVKEKRGVGHIKVDVTVKDEILHIIVEDNGLGMSEERLAQIRTAMISGERVSFGLSAVQERIFLYYGKEYPIDIWSEEGVGTKVMIHIPCNKDK